VEITWDANSEADLAGYKIYMSQTSGTYTTPTATLGEVVLWDSANLPDGIYYFTITAFDDSGNESVKSDEVSIKLDTVAPGQVGGVILTKATKNTVKLDWVSVAATDCVGYKIYQSTTAGGAGTAVATLGKVITWTSGVLADGNYFYTIVAIDDSGNESVKSAEASVRIDTIAPAKVKNPKIAPK
jgi:fibronectin type 3 domain-containing protein